MINFLSLLGWSLDDKTEIMTRGEIVQNFTIDRVSKTAAVFNLVKLEWMNGMYIRNLTAQEFSDRCMPFVEGALPPGVKRPIDAAYLRQIAPLVQERAKLLSEVPSLVDFFFTDGLEYESGLLQGKLEKGQADRGSEADAPCSGEHPGMARRRDRDRRSGRLQKSSA